MGLVFSQSSRATRLRYAPPLQINNLATRERAGNQQFPERMRNSGDRIPAKVPIAGSATVLAATLLLFALPAWAGDLRATDGDSVRDGARRLRLANIDAPELRGRCPAETELAHRARDYLARRLGEGPIIIHPLGRRDRYGRELVTVRVGGSDVGDEMVARGLARRWEGKRRGWCG